VSHLKIGDVEVTFGAWKTPQRPSQAQSQQEARDELVRISEQYQMFEDRLRDASDINPLNDEIPNDETEEA
jgi:hypothetical protein